MSKNKMKPNAEGKFEGIIIKYSVKKPGEDYGKCYIIHTTNLKERMRLWSQKGSKIGGKKIMEAREKYDPNDDWQYEYLEKITMDSPVELMKELKERHRYYIDKFDSRKNGYNTCNGGTGNTDVQFSKEWKEKISKNHRSYQTEEARKKISLSNLGRPVSDVTKAKISKAHKGKPKSDSHKKSMSECRKGKEPKLASAGAALWRQKNGGGSWKGKKMSDEARKNMSKAQRAEKAKAVKVTDADGSVMVFETRTDAAKYFGVKPGCITSYTKIGKPTKNWNNVFENISKEEYSKMVTQNPTL